MNYINYAFIYSFFLLIFNTSWGMIQHQEGPISLVPKDPLKIIIYEANDGHTALVSKGWNEITQEHKQTIHSLLKNRTLFTKEEDKETINNMVVMIPWDYFATLNPIDEKYDQRKLNYSQTEITNKFHLSCNAEKINSTLLLSYTKYPSTYYGTYIPLRKIADYFIDYNRKEIQDSCTKGQYKDTRTKMGVLFKVYPNIILEEDAQSLFLIPDNKITDITENPLSSISKKESLTSVICNNKLERSFFYVT